jgi:predicted small lipoprotein YifL
LYQETKAMKNLFAIVLLVAAMAVTGCGEKKKAAPAAAPPAEKKMEAKPAEGAPPAAAPEAEKK